MPPSNLSSKRPRIQEESEESEGERSDEEQRLEALVFGKKITGSKDKRTVKNTNGKGKMEGVVGDDDADGAGESDEGEPLFFFDSGTGSKSFDLATGQVEKNATDPSASIETHTDGFLSTLQSSGPAKNARPAWEDPADSTLTVSLADNKRLRKLREIGLDGRVQEVVGGEEYEGRLRRQFEKLNPTPAWAVQARASVERKRKRKRVDPAGPGYSSASESSELSQDGSEEEGETLDGLLSTSGLGRRRRKGKAKVLPGGKLELERVRDLNQTGYAKGSIEAFEFHPSAQVAFTASTDRRLRLFQVDGHENPHLQTLHIPDLPLSNGTTTFHPSGSFILVTGPRPYFYTYSLQTDNIYKSSKSLWQGALGGGNPAGGRKIETMRFDSEGQWAAVVGKGGYVHLMKWSSNSGGDGANPLGGLGSESFVGEVKCSSQVRDLAWKTSSGGRKELVTLGEDAVVNVWDVAERRCVDSWRDEGGYGSCDIAVDLREKYLALGSKTGIVNLYDLAKRDPAALRSAGKGVEFGGEEKPVKTVENLTTSITSMRFSRDSQILALASRAKKDALKLLHLPSMTIFSNWPTSGTPLGQVSCVDFSRKNEYLGVGNHRGKVLLYSLKNYSRR